MKIQWTAAAIAALSVLSVSATVAQAKPGMMDKKMPAKPGMMAKMYACKECKMVFSAADAKKMGMKDSMGHKLMMVSKMPAGYKMGHAKMMGHDKMMDKKGGKM